MSSWVGKYSVLRLPFFKRSISLPLNTLKLLIGLLPDISVELTKLDPGIALEFCVDVHTSTVAQDISAFALCIYEKHLSVWLKQHCGKTSIATWPARWVISRASRSLLSPRPTKPLNRAGRTTLAVYHMHSHPSDHIDSADHAHYQTTIALVLNQTLLDSQERRHSVPSLGVCGTLTSLSWMSIACN